jgi:hypothetical protein
MFTFIKNDMLLHSWKSEFETDKKNSIIAQQIINTIHRAEEDVVKQVLQQLLLRDVTLDDYKKVTRVFREGINDKYHLTYDGYCLGEIEMNFNPDTINRYCVRFTPKEFVLVG